MYSACILHVSCSRSCILAFKGGYTHFLYPECILLCILMYSQDTSGYIRIHQDTLYSMYPGRNTEARTGYAQNTSEYVKDTVSWRIHQDTRRIHQDTSGYMFHRKPPHFS